jgi:hypothetical protein
MEEDNAQQEATASPFVDYSHKCQNIFSSSLSMSLVLTREISFLGPPTTGESE